MIDEKVLIEKLEETEQRLLENSTGIDCTIGIANSMERAKKIVNQLAEEQSNGWITDRNPTKEECGGFGKEFQVTVRQYNGEHKTLAMYYRYEIVRGKEVARWKKNGAISTYEVVAWQPFSAPYQPKDCNTCANNTDFDEVDNGCYMCCKGYENNYQPKE